MGQLAGITAALGLIAGIGFGTGLADLLIPEQPRAPTEAELRLIEAHTQLSHPLHYSISVTQSGDGIAEPRTRFYFTKAAREAE